MLSFAGTHPEHMAQSCNLCRSTSQITFPSCHLSLVGMADVKEEDVNKEVKKDIKEKTQDDEENNEDHNVAVSAAPTASVGQQLSGRHLPLKLQALLQDRPLLLAYMCPRIRFQAKEHSAGSLKQNTMGKKRRPKCSQT